MRQLVIKEKYWLFISLCIGLSIVSWAQNSESNSAQNILDSAKPAGYVMDFAGLLSAGEKSALENKLFNYDDSTSSQIAVVAIQSLDGYDAGGYSFELAEKWEIG